MQVNLHLNMNFIAQLGVMSTTKEITRHHALVYLLLRVQVFVFTTG